MQNSFAKTSARTITRAKEIHAKQQTDQELDAQKERDRTATTDFANLVAAQKETQERKDAKAKMLREREEAFHEEMIARPGLLFEFIQELDGRQKEDLPAIPERYQPRDLSHHFQNGGYELCRMIQASALHFLTANPEKFPANTEEAVSLRRGIPLHWEQRKYNIDEETRRKVTKIIQDADFTTCKLIQAAAEEFEKDSPERFPEDAISRVSWLLRGVPLHWDTANIARFFAEMAALDITVLTPISDCVTIPNESTANAKGEEL